MGQKGPTGRQVTRSSWWRVIAIGVVIISLAWISQINYLLFHSLVEIFAVIVAGSVFIIVWNSRRLVQNNYFIFLGVTSLFIGLILLLHTLAYKGMNILGDPGSNMATQLWVLSRYILGFSFILAPLTIKRQINIDRLLAGYGLIVGLLLGTIFYWKIFPVCFVEEVGLTTFKKVSEYFSFLIFLGALVMLVRSKPFFDQEVRKWLMTCLSSFAVSELFFISYINVYGVTNIAGHFFELAGFYFLYKATVEIGLAKPYQLIFRDLKYSEEQLHRSREELELLVAKRTMELAEANEQLQADMTELQDKESRIKTNNELLKLRTQAFSRKEYLNHVVRLVRDLAGCHCAGIRVVNDEGKIPYESYTGFSQSFWESENWLTLAKDHCACIRVIAGTPEPQDMPVLTRGGSFCCGNILSFATNLSEQEKSRFRGVCIKQGYATIIIIPIKYNEKTYGAIHLADERAGVVNARKAEFLESLTPIIGEGIYKFIMADKMEEAKKELSDAKRLSDIGILAATVAHELRNPLAAMRMASYNIRKKAQNPLLDKHLDNIEKKISESNQIINNLLFYSRLKTPHYEATDLADILEECINLAKESFSGKPVAVSKNIRSLKNSPIEADPLLMKELFSNILNNAYDAMNQVEGKIEIGLNPGKEGIVSIYIKDNGIGMDPEILKKAHEPFFTTKSKGTGLGLSVCNQIVHVHKGAISIHSKKGTGTTITINVPRKVKSDDKEDFDY